MRLFLSGFTLLVALVLLAPVGDASAPKGPKPPDYVSASVAFRDAEGDAIKSNGGAYVNGVPSALEVRMWTCADCTQDLTIGTFQSGRTLYFDYTNKIPGSGDGPTGVMYDNAFVNVRAIASMGIGQIRTTIASFGTAVGYFRWLGSPYPAGGHVSGAPYDSQAVIVERTSQTTWNVYTPVPPDSLTEPGYTAGATNVLLKDGRRNTLVPIGNYYMPFGLTVTCPSCL